MKKQLRSYGIITVGSVIFALSFDWFFAANAVGMGGITGLAQISGIDMSTPELLAQTDARMLADLTLVAYFRYIVQTVLGGGKGDAATG